MGRKRKALGQGEQHSRPLVCIECDPLGMLGKIAVCLRLSPRQQPALSMSPPCRVLQKSFGHCSAVSSVRTQSGSFFFFFLLFGSSLSFSQSGSSCSTLSLVQCQMMCQEARKEPSVIQMRKLRPKSRLLAHVHMTSGGTCL